MLKDLSNNEIVFLADCLKKYSQSKSLYSKALTTKDPKTSWEQYKTINWKDNSIKRHIKVTLSKDKEELFTKTFNSNLTKSNTPKNYSTLTDIVSLISKDSKYKEETISEYKIIAKKKIQQKSFDFYKPFFSLFESYGSQLEAIYIAIMSNKVKEKQVILCEFTHKNQYIFTLEFP